MARTTVTTPLPWRQLSVILFIEICFALAVSSPSPYITQLLAGLEIIGGDKRKVGYYLGIIDASYKVTQIITVLHWNRLSDRIGRKPIMLMGIFALMTSMLCFGLSRTFWGLVARCALLHAMIIYFDAYIVFVLLSASRCLRGLLDGNVGVAKSVTGEITDSTNRATSFSLVYVLWAVGASIGPLIGGTFARPNDRFPNIFSGEFWIKYPYFLPSLIVAVIVAASFLYTFFIFRETISPLSSHHSEEETSLLAPTDEQTSTSRQLLIYPVLISILNYVSLDFLSTCEDSLVPLFFGMPIELGGLGFNPLGIGYILTTSRAFAAIFMATAGPIIIRRFGERCAIILALLGLSALWILFPMINLSARASGPDSTRIWFGIGVFICLDGFVQLGYACIFVFITAAAPNQRSLGATNGLAQTVVATTATIAPVIATSLFSLSVEYSLLGGYAVYAVLLSISSLAVLLALELPRDVCPAWEAAEMAVPF